MMCGLRANREGRVRRVDKWVRNDKSNKDGCKMVGKDYRRMSEKKGVRKGEGRKGK